MNIFIWTPLELAANIMTALCIFLAGRNNIHTWWTGIVSSALFGVLFFNNQLYADATLQVFFLITGVIGWIGWNAKNDNGVLKITNTPSDQLVTYLVSAILVAVAYGMLLHKFTDAYAPFVDSVVLTMSVVGQFMLMRKRIESWGIWLIVNTISVPLFWSRELYLTSILYGFFWINAIVSYFQWRKIQRLESVV
jgi:nicotinamide mononucleotide transporter